MSLMLFSGLPGVGKSTLAKMLAAELRSTYLRIDTIEQAIERSDCAPVEICDAGYLTAYALAEDNLAAGNKVIADAVNPLNVIREAWRDIATFHSAELDMIEIICSDKDEHKQRLENRTPDIVNHQLPTWQQVIDLKYEDWTISHSTLDTAGKQETESFIELKELLNI